MTIETTLREGAVGAQPAMKVAVTSARSRTLSRDGAPSSNTADLEILEVCLPADMGAVPVDPSAGRSFSYPSSWAVRKSS
jgi:hypothetical protein